MSLKEAVINQGKTSMMLSKEKHRKSLENKRMIVKVFGELGATSDFPVNLVENKYLRIAINTIVDHLFPSSSITLSFPSRTTVKREVVNRINEKNKVYLKTFQNVIKSQNSPAIAYTSDSSTSKAMHPYTALTASVIITNSDKKWERNRIPKL
jgi:hypothetical protein